MKRHIAIDLGAESGRAIVGWLQDGKLVMEELHRFPTGELALGGHLRWNVYRFYEEILTALSKYARQFGSSLDSIGIDTWGLDYGLVDDGGELLALPHHYRDSRTDGVSERAEAMMPRERLYEITGTQYLSCNTIYQLLAETESCTSPLDRAKGMRFIGDLLHQFLCGSGSVEYTVASISQLVDVRTRTWSQEVFEAHGLPKSLQAPIVQPGDCLGELDPKITRSCGLASGVRVIAPAVHDTASAAAAVPAADGNWGYISSGTWCIAGLETDAPQIDETSCRLSLSNSGGAFGKNLLLKNVMGLWIIQQCKKSWNRTQPDLRYADISALAASAPPFAGFLDPDDGRFFHPEDGAVAVQAYLRDTNQNVPDDIGAIARIVFESLALKYRYVFERLTAATGTTLDTLHLIGGGTQNELLCQLTANAIGVQAIAGPVEATAMGNLLLQCYGCGEIGSLAELRAVVAETATLHTYQPQDRPAWDAAYERFLSVCHIPTEPEVQHA